MKKKCFVCHYNMALDVLSLENGDYHRTKTYIIYKYLVYINSTLTSFYVYHILSYFKNNFSIFDVYWFTKMIDQLKE